MAEEKDTQLKVTDRRKFNADGTPRELPPELAAPPTEQAPTVAETPLAAEDPSQAERAQSNVVSFPGEAGQKKDRADSQPAVTLAPGQQTGTEQSDAASAHAAQAKAAASAAEQAYNQMKPRTAPGLPEASLLSLLDMLAGEAAMCMGMVKNPSGAEIPTDLDTARQVIDMLAMLQQKTRGNLTAEETDVLENILAYLRMQFVALSRNK
jgi:hypothetical protein